MFIEDFGKEVRMIPHNISRRRFLKLMTGGAIGSLMLGSYAFAVEPLYRLRVKNYRPQLSNWPSDLNLRIAVLADIHACKPWMTVERIRYIVQETNRLKPDLILLLGDYTTGMNLITEQVHSHEWAPVLGELDAPLGVHAVLGNHDYWEDRTVQRLRKGKTFGHLALEKAGIPVYENDVLQLKKGKHKFWLAGLGDQLAFPPFRKFGYSKWKTMDDLPGTLAKITDDSPIIMMAHEPDIFENLPDHVALTVSGHTHGGQVRFFGYAPITASTKRLNYGLVQEDGKSLVVSCGLGCSMLPVRFGTPPEIVIIKTGARHSA